MAPFILRVELLLSVTLLLVWLLVVCDIVLLDSFGLLKHASIRFTCRTSNHSACKQRCLMHYIRVVLRVTQMKSLVRKF